MKLASKLIELFSYDWCTTTTTVCTSRQQWCALQLYSIT